MSLPQNDQQIKTNLARPSQVALGQTQCALLTGEGRSAIAVVTLDGPDAKEIIQSCVQFASDRPVRVSEIRLGHWIGPQRHADQGETVVLSARHRESRDSSESTEPRDPTALDRWEIHCHGGPAAIERIFADLQSCGAQRVARPTTKSPLILVEAESVLARCMTEATAAVAMNQVRGALRDWALHWLSRPASPEVSNNARSEAEAILRSADWTTRLTVPWKIVLIGSPNVGKSSLLNALVGFERSITLDQAGTTRDVLHAETVIDGVPVQLSDTAGIRDSHEPIEAEGMRRALDAAGSADLVVQIEDAASRAPADMPPTTSTRSIRVLNKIDLCGNRPDLTDFDIATSAVTGEGIEALLARLGEELNRFAPPPDAPVVLNERQRGLVAKIAADSSATDPSLGSSLAATLRELIGEIHP